MFYSFFLYIRFLGDVKSSIRFNTTRLTPTSSAASPPILSGEMDSTGGWNAAPYSFRSNGSEDTGFPGQGLEQDPFVHLATPVVKTNVPGATASVTPQPGFSTAVIGELPQFPPFKDRRLAPDRYLAPPPTGKLTCFYVVFKGTPCYENKVILIDSQ